MESVKSFLYCPVSSITEMISIKQNVAELERLEQLCQQTLDCYVDSLDGVAKYGILACPPLVAKFKPRFAALHKTAVSTKNRGDERQQTLASLRSDLNREIKQYSDEASSHYEEEAAAMKDIVALLAGTSESIQERGVRCTDKVAAVSNNLEEVVRLEDLSSMRRTLSEQVRNLRQWTEQLKMENAASVLALQKEVSAVREKLEQSEMAASTDVLTGLSNRYVAENQMALRIAKGTGFCLLLFDLDEFKSIMPRAMKRFASSGESCASKCGLPMSLLVGGTMNFWRFFPASCGKRWPEASKLLRNYRTVI